MASFLSRAEEPEKGVRLRMVRPRALREPERTPIFRAYEHGPARLSMCGKRTVCARNLDRSRPPHHI